MTESGATAPEITTETVSVPFSAFTYSCASSGATVTVQDAGGSAIATHVFPAGMNQQLPLNGNEVNAVLVTVVMEPANGKQFQYHAPYNMGIKTAAYNDAGSPIGIGYTLGSMEGPQATAKPTGTGPREPGAPEPIPFSGVDYTDPDSGADATAWAEEGPQQGHIDPGTGVMWHPGGTNVNGISVEQTDGVAAGQWISYDCQTGFFMSLLDYDCVPGEITIQPTEEEPDSA